MGEIETKLKELIISRYGSLKKFTDTIDMPWTTLDSILKRGVLKSNITSLLRITKELNIDTESLASGKITDTNQPYLDAKIILDESNLLFKYRTLDDKGKHTVDTVLEMEHNRCRTEKNIYLVAESEEQYGVKAAHNDAPMTEEEKKLMRQDLDEL